MTDKANKPDVSRLIGDVETLEKFVQDFKTVIKSLPTEKQDERLYRIALQVSGLKFPEIISELIRLESFSFDLPSGDAQYDEFTGEDRTIEQLEQLKQELDSRDEKIQEFKLTLADSVMEFRGLEKKNSLLNDTISSLRTEISQLQLHSKDVSMRLETAEKNFESTSKALAKASEELFEVKNQSYNLKSRGADLEDQIRELNTKIANISEESAARLKELEKFKKLSGGLNTSFDFLKIEHSALLERAAEMEATIDSLQKEKSFLQIKLNNLLTGIPRSVSYSPAVSATASDTSLLEPEKFTPYIPFCFPDRIPEVIKFRKQIKQSFAKVFPRTRKSPPEIFPQDFELKFEEEHTRFFSFRPHFSCSINREFHYLFSDPQVSDTRETAMGNLTLIDHEMIPTFPDHEAENIAKKRQKLLQRTTAFVAQKRVEFKSKPEFGIHTNSLDLLLSFLSRNIIESNCLELKHPTPLIEQIGTASTKHSKIEITNIFNEKLAFRYGYQLKSHKLYLHQGDFAQNFKRGAGLKSVLETFGNTISSMVERYDIFSSKHSTKKDSVKT